MIRPAPSRQKLEAYLADFHHRHPGSTSAALGRGLSPYGASSYEHLADQAPACRDGTGTVLELACGDGAALDVLRQRRSWHRLVGVDLCLDEITLARGRLGPKAAFVCGRAQQLPFASHSVDFLCSHLLLTLVADVEQAVLEMWRVLKRGATLSVTVPAEDVPGAVPAAFQASLTDTLQRYACPMPPPLGDPRTRTVEGLRSLFGNTTGFVEPVTVEDFPLRLDGPPDAVWQILALTYVVDRLPTAVRDSLKAQLLPVLADLAGPDGTLPFAVGLRQLTCRTRSLRNPHEDAGSAPRSRCAET